MNSNLLERINLLESVKDNLIKRLQIERDKRDKAYKLYYVYKNREIYVQLDTEHCIDKLCEHKAAYDKHRARVHELSLELKSVQLELISLYEMYNALDFLGLHESNYDYSTVNYF